MDSVEKVCSFCTQQNQRGIEPVDSYSSKRVTLRIQDVIAQHFWFTPEQLKSFLICTSCWDRLLDFHVFYCQVEQLYKPELPQLKSEEVDLKDEEDQTANIVEQLEALDSDPHGSYEELDAESGVDESVIEEEIIYEVELEDLGQPDDTESTDADLEKKQNDSENKRIKDQDILTYCQMDCQLCSKQFETFNQLNQHYSAVHNQKGYVICCNLRFDEPKRLREHIRVHIDPAIFQCPECQKNFCSKRSVQCHQLSVHLPDEQKPFQCQVCTKRFAKQYQLNTHMVQHSEQKDFPCPKCQKPFTTNGALQFHIRNIHDRAYEVMCDVCSKMLRSKSALLAHRAEHFNTKRVQCPTCGQWMKNENTLRKHLVRHKEETIVIECHICGKRSPNSHALKKHIRDQHTVQRTHQCTMCDKAFKRALALKEHMATHTGQQLYSCVHCGKEFNSSANLCSHRKKAHPAEWHEYQRQKPTFRSSD